MGELEDKVLHHLQYLNTLQPGFKIQRFIEYPCQWIEYSFDGVKKYIEDYGLPNHREILFFEIVLDIDCETKEAGQLHANAIEKVLIEKKFAYKRWDSGGTGVHFHLNYRIMHMKMIAKMYSIGEIRLALIKNIVPEHLLIFKDSKVCLHNKTLIQIEHMLHRKGGYKTLVSKVDGINEIPEEVYLKLYRQKQRFDELKRIQKEDAKKLTTKQKNRQVPECIRFFEGEDIHQTNISGVQDGIYRILFSLVNFYLQREVDKETLEDLMVVWRDSLPKGWLEKSKKKVSDNIIRYMINKSNGSAGCRYRSLILEDINCSHICKNCPYKVER